MKEQTITIKGQPYKLIVKDDYFLSEDNVCVGQANYSNNTIIVSLSSIDWQKTLLHELYHCFFRECGLMEYKSDETLVEWLAQTFEQVGDALITGQNFIYKYIKSKKKK